MNKQDRTASRTAADVERKYGKRFIEIMGTAEDARKTAEEAEELFEGLDQEAIFNLLTNNGAAKGIFRDEDGQLYINASYLAAGIIKSADGKIQINLGEGASVPTFNTGISTNGLTVRSDEANAQKLIDISAYKDVYDNFVAQFLMNSTNGVRLVTLLENFLPDLSGPAGVSMYFYNQAHDKHCIIATAAESAGLFLMNEGVNVGTFLVNADGKTQLTANRVVATKLNGKNISWKDNGDGTFTLVGTD